MSLWLLIGCASSGQLSSTAAQNEASPAQTLTHYQFSDLDNLMVKEPRLAAVFLHVPWCQFCRNMEHTTLRNDEVVKLLNEHYYFISFDGEQEEDVSFRGHTFHYQPTGRNTGTHELATALGTMDNALTYPTLVLLDEEYNIIFQHNAFLNSEEMIGVLQRAMKP